MLINDFINYLGTFGLKYAPKYGFKCISPMIAQGILETGLHNIDNETGLFPYNNFFGLKCGGSWNGKSVNMQTKEEYNGNMVDISDNFRVFDSFEQGVEGYYDFLDWFNYENLKGITDPYTYLEVIKKDGYATSSNYVIAVYHVIEEYNLKEWDSKLVSGHKYKVGDRIEYTKIHTTAYDSYPLTPYITSGVISEVINAPNPYLVGDCIGWVAEEDIIVNMPLRVGDIVKVTNPVDVYGNDIVLYFKEYQVMELAGTRAVIGVNGVVTAAISTDYIEKV